MRMPVLTCVFILIVLIAFSVRRGKDSYAREEASFWDRERRANSTRKKPIDDLKYIEVPQDLVSSELQSAYPEITEYAETLSELSGTQIVNLTGISNTDLKLKYGTANITSLSVFDQRYTLLVSTLQRIADVLVVHEDTNAARRILEYAVSIGTDVSSAYKLLAFIYASDADYDSIKALIPKVQALSTPLKDSIIASLNGYINDATPESSDA